MAILQLFCTGVLVKNFFPRLSLSKGKFSFLKPFIMEPHLPLPRRIWLVITVRALQNDVAVRLSVCFFFTKLRKPSFLSIFLQGLLSLTFGGPLLVNSLWDTIFSQYPFLPLFKSFLDAFPDVFITDMIHCKHIVPFSKIRF